MILLCQLYGLLCINAECFMSLSSCFNLSLLHGRHKIRMLIGLGGLGCSILTVPQLLSTVTNASMHNHFMSISRTYNMDYMIIFMLTFGLIAFRFAMSHIEMARFVCFIRMHESNRFITDN